MLAVSCTLNSALRPALCSSALRAHRYSALRTPQFNTMASSSNLKRNALRVEDVPTWEWPDLEYSGPCPPWAYPFRYATGQAGSEFFNTLNPETAFQVLLPLVTDGGFDYAWFPDKTAVLAISARTNRWCLMTHAADFAIRCQRGGLLTEPGWTQVVIPVSNKALYETQFNRPATVDLPLPVIEAAASGDYGAADKALAAYFKTHGYIERDEIVGDQHVVHLKRELSPQFLMLFLDALPKTAVFHGQVGMLVVDYKAGTMAIMSREYYYRFFSHMPLGQTGGPSYTWTHMVKLMQANLLTARTLAANPPATHVTPTRPAAAAAATAPSLRSAVPKPVAPVKAAPPPLSCITTSCGKPRAPNGCFCEECRRTDGLVDDTFVELERKPKKKRRAEETKDADECSAAVFVAPDEQHSIASLERDAGLLACLGCQNDEPNQMAHVGPASEGFCMPDAE